LVSTCNVSDITLYTKRTMTSSRGATPRDRSVQCAPCSCVDDINSPIGILGTGSDSTHTKITIFMAYYPSQTGQHPVASGAYPYSTYSYTQTPGAYPYTTGTYPGTAVTGYGTAWPYSYSYYQHQPTSSLSKPATTQPAATAATATLPASAQRTTFTAYNPTYSRENAGTSVAGGPSSRAYKKQSNLKGLFTKERASDPVSSIVAPNSTPLY